MPTEIAEPDDMVEQAVTALLERIVPALSPEAVYLFGSRARGDAARDSGFDLLVVVSDDTPRDKIRLTSTYRLTRGTGIPADVIACRRRWFERNRDRSAPSATRLSTRGASSMGDEAVRWLAVAETDLKAVRNNLHGPEPTLEVAAYHCQQAAEKIVKAAPVAVGVDPPRWHNIDDLVDLLPVEHTLRKPLAPLGRLTPYAVAYRYPMPDPDIAPDIPPPEDIMQWLDDLQRAKAAVAAAGRGVIGPETPK
jgi:predicted nucleotidyltransferase/HEPN domain-containing protein